MVFNTDFSVVDEEQQARKRYKKDLGHLKPDLEAYNKQKELALGLAPGTLKPGHPVPSPSTTLINFDSRGGQVRRLISILLAEVFFIVLTHFVVDRRTTTSRRIALPRCEQLAICRQQTLRRCDRPCHWQTQHRVRLLSFIPFQ